MVSIVDCGSSGAGSIPACGPLIIINQIIAARALNWEIKKNAETNTNIQNNKNRTM